MTYTDCFQDILHTICAFGEYNACCRVPIENVPLGGEGGAETKTDASRNRKICYKSALTRVSIKVDQPAV
jgi:hypothetical protein